MKIFPQKQSDPMPVLVFIVLGLFAVATSAEEDPLLLSDACGRDISTLLPPPYSNSSFFTCASVWNTFILRHSQSDNILTIIVSAVYTSGWIGLGFSKDGMMVGSSAMVGWIDEFGRAICKQYYLQGLTQSEVIPDKGELHLTDVPTVAILHGATIYVGFQLKLAGRLSRQQILLAFGSEYPVQNQLCHHDDKTTIVFDFSAGYMANAPISIDDMKKNHGALGIIAWGVLLPAGAIAARYFRHLDPNWYYAHIFIQSMGFIIGLSGVLSGIQLHGKMRVDIPIHRGIGLFLLLLTMLQVMAFFLRPSKDSKFRRCWKCYHHVAGRLILFLGALNIALGIQDGSADYCWSIAYGFILAMVLITVSVLEVLLWTRRCERKTEPPASK